MIIVSVAISGKFGKGFKHMDNARVRKIVNALTVKMVGKCPTCQKDTNRILLDDGSGENIKQPEENKRLIVKIICDYCGYIQEFEYERLIRERGDEKTDDLNE